MALLEELYRDFQQQKNRNKCLKLSGKEKIVKEKEEENRQESDEFNKSFPFPQIRRRLMTQEVPLKVRVVPPSPPPRLLLMSLSKESFT